MSKRQFLMLLGIWVIIFLFLGFPSTWDKILSIIAGALILMTAYKIRTPMKPAGTSMPYVEHKSEVNKESDEHLA